MKVEINELSARVQYHFGEVPPVAVANVILSNDHGKVLFEFFLSEREYDLIKERDEGYKKARAEELIIEDLSALEHEQWTKWSKSLAKREDISDERRASWESYWIPYGLLREETKEDNRRWARRALKIVREADLFYHKKDAKKTSDRQELENVVKSLGRAEVGCAKKS
jgi:hypothetical protein